MKVFYSEEYVAAGESFDTTRKSGWIAQSLAKHPISNLELCAPAPLSDAELSLVHDPAYVRAVREGDPRSLASSQGFDWDSGLWRAVCASNGGAVAAAREALRSGVSGSLSSGLHHAKYARGAGFCTFNGLIAAAHAALESGCAQVLILDLDAHCGGGTFSMLGARNVQHTDISTSDFDSYTPTGKHTLELVQDETQYLSLIERRLSALEPRSFGLCLYNAGMDPFDPRVITREVLRAREEMVFAWCQRKRLPIAFVLAGGYIGIDLSQDELVALHRLTLEAAARHSMYL